MNKNKKKYIQLCHDNDIPIFSQYYWLDAVCGEDNWDVIIVEENGNILASLPYFLNKNEDGYEIRKPPLTQSNGVYFYYPNNLKHDRKIAFENKVMDIVINEIENLDIIRYRQYFHYSFLNWLPFYWRGYTQTTRYTYVIEDTSDIDVIYNNFNGNIRTNIKKSQQMVSICIDMSYKDFFALNEKIFNKQGIQTPYNFELFEKLYTNLEKHDCVKILYAKDKFNQIHSAVLFVYDNTSFYYLMSGSEEKYRSSQSLTLLIFEGIKMANKLGKIFDFEGSMKKNIEKFFRDFGAIQKPYFDISKNFLKVKDK